MAGAEALVKAESKDRSTREQPEQGCAGSSKDSGLGSEVRWEPLEGFEQKSGLI